MTKDVAVYGAGRFGRLFAEEIESSGGRVSYFIDEYLKVPEVAGRPVKRLKDVQFDTVRAYASIPTVGERLRADGMECLTFGESIRVLPGLLKKLLRSSGMWYRDSLNEMLDQEKIKAFRELLVDQYSRDLLNAIVKFRADPIPKNYVSPQTGHVQYFPDDVDLFSGLAGLKLVDCGAFDGDTLRAALLYSKKKGLCIESVACFEPDPANLVKLKRQSAELGRDHPNIKIDIHSAGVWTHSTTLAFDANAGSASAVSMRSDATVVVPVVALDDVVLQMQPNYIKMDVEGSEVEAIKGARHIIERDAPALAISLYHRPSHLWEIPLLIQSIQDQYDMYLRLYGELGLETVLYCVPKETQ